jgi:hypothetical protein
MALFHSATDSKTAAATDRQAAEGLNLDPSYDLNAPPFGNGH